MKYLFFVFLLFHNSLLGLDLAPEEVLNDLPFDKKYEELKKRIQIGDFDDFTGRPAEVSSKILSLSESFQEAYDRQKSTRFLILARFLQLQSNILSQNHKHSERLLQEIEPLLPIDDLFYQAHFLYYKGRIQYEQGNFKEAATWLKKGLDLFQADADNPGQYLILSYLAYSAAQQGENDRAIDFTKKNIELMQNLGLKKYEMIQTRDIGTYYMNQGDMAEALDHFVRGLEFFESQNLDYEVVITLNQIAVLKQIIGKKEDGLEFYLKAEKRLDSHKVPVWLKILILENIFNGYKKRRDFSQSKIYYEKALKLAKEHDLHRDLIYIQTIYASQKTAEGQPKKAVSILDSIKDIPQKYWRDFDRFLYQVNLFEAHFESGDLHEAKDHFYQAEKYSKAIGRKDSQLTLYGKGYKLFEQLGDVKKSYKYYKIYAESKEKIEKEKNKKLLYARENEYISTQNRLLEKENLLQLQELKTARYLKIILLISLALILIMAVALTMIRRKNRIISNQKRKIEDILTHIELGIATVGSDEKMDAEYSPKTLELFDLPETTNLSQLTFEALLQKIDIDDDMYSQITNVIRLCFESEIENFLMNKHILQGEFATRDKRILQIDWYPIVANDLIVKLMIVAKDVTETKALQRAIGQKETHYQVSMEVFAKLGKQSRSLKLLFDKTSEVVEELERDTNSHTDPQAILATLHSLKGNSRLLEQKQLTTAIHHVESFLQAGFPSSDKTSEKEALKQAIHDLKTLTHLYRETLSQFSGESKNDSPELGNYLEAIAAAQKNIETMLAHEDIELGTFTVNCTSSPGRDELYQDTIDIITHALTNAADHGYILPKKEQGFVQRQAAFYVKIAPDRDCLLVEIQDRGVGLDKRKIEALAKKRGFKLAGQQSVYDILFETGLSTSASTTETSGRGVGLSAIRRIAEKHHGSASIAPGKDGGTVLTVRLPVASRTLAAG